MPQDLVVPPDQTVNLDASDPGRFKESFAELSIKSFDDLVSHSLVSSEASLGALLSAAQTATRTALASGPVKAVPGTTRRPDLGRFANFRANATDVDSVQASIFWSVAREVPPALLVSGKVSSSSELPVFHRLPSFSLADITIESGATLKVTAKHLACRNLLIKHTGKLSCVGSGLYVQAASIEGK